MFLFLKWNIVKIGLIVWQFGMNSGPQGKENSKRQPVILTQILQRIRLYPIFLTHTKGGRGSVNIYFHLVVTIFNAWGHLVSFTNPLAAGSEAADLSIAIV